MAVMALGMPILAISRRKFAPHEHRWDLAESEELVTFWILRVFDGKRVGFF
jgi:hypothetical protein